jgi:tRNA A58 N-methylase Trm61
VGCGLGDVSFAVARLVGPQGRVLGVDAADDVVDLARARAWEVGADNVRSSKQRSPTPPWTKSQGLAAIPDTNLDLLAQRLRDEGADAQVITVMPPLICAYARV